jgi:hypothetical protein
MDVVALEEDFESDDAYYGRASIIDSPYRSKGPSRESSVAMTEFPNLARNDSVAF